MYQRLHKQFGWQLIDGIAHGLINNIETKAKCRHLKKMFCKGSLRQVFLRVSLETGDTVCHVGIFNPALWTIAPLNFSLVQLSPPSLCQSTLHTDSVWLGGVGGFWVLWETIFCRSLTLCILTRCRTYKIATPPQTKTDKHLPLSHFIGQFFPMTIFCFGVCIVN